MLAPKQQKWIDHLSNESKIKIVPFDPTSEEKFQKIKQLIQKSLGENIPVEHHGSTNLGISGQDEIDIYIPVNLGIFNDLIPKLKELFGEPRSLYPLERARFTTYEGKKRIDLFLVNKESESWLENLKFENYLKTHPELLKEYEKLKTSCNGLGTKEYYRLKTEFINEVISSK